MQYISTRGNVAPVNFEQVLLEGQAPDGGLFLPKEFPSISSRLENFRNLTFSELAFEIISLYATDLDQEVLRQIVNDAFATFDHPQVTPLVQFEELNVLELFHGPTLAFKDIALQVVGRLFEYVLRKHDDFMNILGATSGDTGSAAIAGVRGRDRIGIFIMFPDGRTSPLQEIQMTSVTDGNVHCLAIDGSFDDCQHIMKSIFNDLEFKQQTKLGAVNSINWARIMVQIVYYVYSALRFQEPVSFSVPTGNFGNILSAIIAMKMGTPIRKLVLGTNENDILSKFFTSGQYQRGEVHQTLSPSMDIQVASNLERFIYTYLHGDTNRLRQFMEIFTSTGEARLESEGQLDTTIDAKRIDTSTTLATIQHVWEKFGYVLDPHTAVGVAASSQLKLEGPLINVATAHPAKFPEAVNRATQSVCPSHPRLDLIKELETRKVNLPNSIEVVHEYIADHAMGKD